jgi:ferredoxin
MTAETSMQRYAITLAGHGSAIGFEGERVLVALERAQGLGRLKDLPHRLPVGCRRGGCGICRARITSGKYRSDPMSREHVSAEDEAAGFVLSCCVYPMSDLSLRLEPSPALKPKCAKSQETSQAVPATGDTSGSQPNKL